MSNIPGEAPAYTMSTDLGRVQPVFATDDLVFCPAENWARINVQFGYYPANCAANGLMHTGFPDPVTRRRMREAFKRRT